MERIRLFDRRVKTEVRSDKEAWDIHVAVTHRLSEAKTPGALAIAQADYETTYAMCVERGLLLAVEKDYEMAP